MFSRIRDQAGKVRTGILLWLLGVPLPIILIIWALTVHGDAMANA